VGGHNGKSGRGRAKTLAKIKLQVQKRISNSKGQRKRGLPPRLNLRENQEGKSDREGVSRKEGGGKFSSERKKDVAKDRRGLRRERAQEKRKKPSQKLHIRGAEKRKVNLKRGKVQKDMGRIGAGPHLTPIPGAH